MRTPRYTYVRNIWGPWLLYDNVRDPFQLTNLLQQPESNSSRSGGQVAQVSSRLERLLQRWLHKLGDEFLSGAVLLKKAGLDHYWEAHVPWRVWETQWSQEPFTEPTPEQAARL